jgi:hypothetical protein
LDGQDYRLLLLTTLLLLVVVAVEKTQLVAVLLAVVEQVKLFMEQAYLLIQPCPTQLQ